MNFLQPSEEPGGITWSTLHSGSVPPTPLMIGGNAFQVFSDHQHLHATKNTPELLKVAPGEPQIPTAWGAGGHHVASPNKLNAWRPLPPLQVCHCFILLHKFSVAVQCFPHAILHLNHSKRLLERKCAGGIPNDKELTS